MKTVLFTAALAVAGLFGSVGNAALLGLSNTGGAGWSVSGTNGGVGLTTVTTNNPAWGTLAGASWFSTAANTATTSSPLGTYSYTTAFSVAAGNQVNLSFNFLNDNSIKVTIESAEKGIKSLFVGLDNFSGAGTPITVAQSDISFTGPNTLRFEVVNLVNLGGPNPVGLDVRFTAQTADFVPEPASMVLWGGLCGLGLVFRLRSKKRKVS